MNLSDALHRSASPPLRAWLARHTSQVEGVAAAAVGCVAYGHDAVYDSEGRRYVASYRVVAAALDGESTVVVSHRPRDFAWTEGYPPEFQSRDLGSAEEIAKIRSIARTLDPTRLLGQNLDATLGPPVVWKGPDNRLFVLGGNGRTLGFLLADDAAYARYAREAKCRWADRWPAHDPPARHRWLMVRVVRGADRAQAAQIAAASQRSTAAEEGRIGRAIGLARSLQLDAHNLPSVMWTEPLSPENIGAFGKANRGFLDAILDRLDPAQRSHAMLDEDRQMALVTGVLLSLLPPSLRTSGLFESSRVEDALIGALPAIATSHSLALAREIPENYDLLPMLPDAIAIFQALRRMRLSFVKVAQVWDAERRTSRMEGFGRVSDAPDLAMALAAALYNASRRSAPEAAIAEMLKNYLYKYDAALDEWVLQTPFAQQILFGVSRPIPPPAPLLASKVSGFTLPGTAASEPAVAQSGMFARANRGRR